MVVGELGWFCPRSHFSLFQPPVAMSQVRAAITDFGLFGKDYPSPIKRSPALREDCGGKSKYRTARACGWGVLLMLWVVAQGTGASY
jgi:hypothetical protein